MLSVLGEMRKVESLRVEEEKLTIDREGEGKGSRGLSSKSVSLWVLREEGQRGKVL